MQRILLEGPAVEPVLLAEAKAHLRLDGAAEDDLLAAMLAAARVTVETEIRAALIAQKWRALFDFWPREGVLLPLRPVLSVEAVRAIDGAGSATVLPPADYELRLPDGTVRLVGRPLAAERFEIDFTAGYGASGLDVPQPLRQAIRLLVTHWFEHRAAAMEGEGAGPTPLGYRALVAPYRRLALC